MPSDFTYSQFPAGDWIDSGAVVSYVYSSPVHTSSSGAEFALQSTSGPASPFTVSGIASISGEFASEKTTVATCAGTFPTDTCTGTPAQPDGTLSASSSATGIGVDISGTTATQTVTLTTTDYGSTPPPTGADVNLGGGGAYYDVTVSAASDGIAHVCITNPNIYFGTTMDYWNGVSWVSAANIEVIGITICGDIPVSALTGTPIGTGTPTACSGSSPIVTCIGDGVSVEISGVTAEGAVTVTISSLGGTPPSASGPDGNLRGAPGQYYDVRVGGATGGSAAICVSPSNGATNMDYYDSTTSRWTSIHVLPPAATEICGDNIPVLAFTGTPIAIGTPTTSQGIPEFPASVGGLLLTLLLGLPLMLAIKVRRGNQESEA